MKTILTAIAAGIGLFTFAACGPIHAPHNPTPAPYALQPCPTDGTSFGYNTSCVPQGVTPHNGSLERIVRICHQDVLVPIAYNPFQTPDCSGR